MYLGLKHGRDRGTRTTGSNVSRGETRKNNGNVCSLSPETRSSLVNIPCMVVGPGDCTSMCILGDL